MSDEASTAFKTLPRGISRISKQKKGKQKAKGKKQKDNMNLALFALEVCY